MKYYEDKDLSLKKDARGNYVKELQEELSKLGYPAGVVDGIFGPATEKAVKLLQQDTLVNGTVDFDLALRIHKRATKTTPTLSIEFIESPNQSLRRGQEINLLVIHYTASGDLESTVRWFENPTANASAHYVIGVDGKIVQMVEEEKKAWHAGKSKWKGQENCNNFSIGIELVNWGILKKKGGQYLCWPKGYTAPYSGPEPVKASGKYWQPFSEEQYQTLISLTKSIIGRHHIALSQIVGHCDIAPGRKVDPGPGFDWVRFKSNLV